MLPLHRQRHRVSRTATTLIALAVAFGCFASDTPRLDLAHYRGDVVVVDFWASWCKPCRQSIPWLNQLRQRYAAQGLVIIGVNVDANRADADRFQRDVRFDFDVLYDPQGKLAEQFRVQGMPSSFVFDRDGRLAQTLLGFREATRAEHEARILDLLKRKPS